MATLESSFYVRPKTPKEVPDGAIRSTWERGTQRHQEARLWLSAAARVGGKRDGTEQGSLISLSHPHEVAKLGGNAQLRGTGGYNDFTAR